jgi:hypothetical protein
MGCNSANTNSGCYVIAFGINSARKNTGCNVTFIGRGAGYNGTLDVGNALSTAFGIGNLTLPSFVNYATASASITVGTGGVTGTTYLYYDQTSCSIGAVRL